VGIETIDVAKAMKANSNRVETVIVSKSANLRLSTACLGVIMPVFNEAKTINEIVRRVLAQPTVCELIIIDDASDDGTMNILRLWPQRDERVRVLEHRTNQGKGAAIRTGWAASIAPVIIMQDADLEYDPHDYPSMLELIINDKADVVYGSRFSGKNNPSSWAWHTCGNRCLTLFSNFMCGLKLTDEATCYKMFRRDVFERIRLEENGFGFCPEVTAKISKLGVRVREVPVSYHGRTKAEGKKIRFWHGLNALYCIIKYNFFC
jgi:glycosyltransferase involved in cell wall biosynthesis